MKMTKAEVKEQVQEGENIEEIQGEDRRWSRRSFVIFKRDEKFYRIYWEEALTENQDHEFEDQEAEEVKPIEETIVVKKWVKV